KGHTATRSLALTTDRLPLLKEPIMRRILLVLSLALFSAGTALGQAHLVPTDASLAPLTMVAHHVTVSIDEQAAVTKVEQTFHNNANRQLEATYLFPVP